MSFTLRSARSLQCGPISEHRGNAFIRTAKSAFCVAALVATQAVAADTVLHDVNGYPSTNDGLVGFDVLVFNDDGWIAA